MQSYLDYRSSFLKGDTERDRGLATPDDITREDNIRYAGHKDNVMDIYYPKGTEGLNPAIVSVHGGAWVSGSKETYQYYCMSLAQRGFTVVNCSYRLAPETVFPGSIEDINKVFTWIMANGREHHIDTGNLFAVSDSSGAQITSQYAAILTNPGFAALFPFSAPEGLKLRAIALNCGVYDAKTYLLADSDAPIHYYVQDMSEANLEAMNTTKYITSSYPPSFIITANRDFLRKNAEPMHELLKSLGVPSELRVYGTDEKMLGHVFHLDIRNDTAVSCSDEECAFFRSYLKEEA